MKTRIKNLFLLPALIAALGLMLTDRATAQTFMTLHTFSPQNFVGTSNTETNGDGASPWAGLISSGNTLYGTAEVGGTGGNGTVFAVNTDGMNFTNLHNFTVTVDNNQNIPTNRDGAGSLAGLILSGNTLYGTASGGGTNGSGTIFAINTNGTGFMPLHTFAEGSFNDSNTFTNSDGAAPQSGLLLSGNTLYGTANQGGTNGDGTVFAININGTGLMILHTFASGAFNGSHIFTNSDGVGPVAGLILSGNTLFGTAEMGGTNGYGTVFAINTNGTGFTTLHTFNGSDGDNPWAGLTLSGNTLYGTTVNGGSSGRGAIFAVNTNGTSFTNLYLFSALVSSANSGGANPWAGLILSGNILYGVAAAGGPSGQGTVFTVNTNATANGMGFTNIYSLTNTNGSFPVGALVLSGNTLYGTAELGGTNDNGTVFSFALPPSVPAPLLTITLSGTNVILSWMGVGFNLQSTTNLASPNWITIGGQNAVTNPIPTIPQKFFRLSQ